MKPRLLDPAAYVKSVKEADKEVDGSQIVGITGCKPPWEEGQRKQRHTVGGQGDGDVPIPASAVGDVAVLGVHFETVDLAEEQQGEDQVCELVGERHHPAGIVADAWNEKQNEECREAVDEVQVQPKPSGAGIQPDRLNQHGNGDDKKCRQDDAGQYVAHRSQNSLEAFLFCLVRLVHLCKVTLSFDFLQDCVYL